MPFIDIVQTVAIIISLGIAIKQMQIYNRSLNASTHSAISSKVYEINRLLIEKPDLFLCLDESFQVNQESNPKKNFMDILWILFEEIYFQRHKYGFIDDSSWQSWVQTIRKILKRPYAQGHWNEAKDEFPKEFRDFVDDLFNNLEVNSSSASNYRIP